MPQPLLPCLLVVDDDPGILRLLVTILSVDYDVTTAESAADALEMLGGGSRFDCMITDAMMADTDGFELTAALRASPDTADMPIIMLTALADAEHKERAHRAGVSAYMTKPFDPELLEATIAMELMTSALR